MCCFLRTILNSHKLGSSPKIVTRGDDLVREFYNPMFLVTQTCYTYASHPGN